LRLRELGSRREELLSRLSNLNGELDRLRAVEEELRGIEVELGREGVIRASIEDLRRRRDSLIAELNSLTGLSVESVAKELGVVNEELANVNRELEEVGKAKVELAEIRGKLASAGELESRAAAIEGRLSEIARAKGDTEVRIRELEGRVRELDEVRNSIGVLSARRDLLVREVGELRGRVNALRDRVGKLKVEISSREVELGNLRSGLGRFVNAMDTLTKLQQVLDDIKPIVRRIFLDSVNEELNAMAKELMHKTSYTSIEVDEDYGVLIRRSDGVTLPVESLSVGERNLVSLMLRYAIARVVMGVIPILILDEPTEHLDEEHRRRMLGWVRGLSNGVRTVIITSHVDALETIADNIIRVGFINDRGESMFANS